MQVDFDNAHERHWHDAEILWGSSRWANADHLYGLATECGLKRLMQAFGMPLSVEGNPTNREDWVHADKAWTRYEAYRSRGGSSYTLPLNNPFTDWAINQRYAKHTAFTAPRVEQHRIGAENVHDLVRKAKMDGLL